MNVVEISCENIKKPDWINGVEGFCRKVMDELIIKNQEVSLLLCNDGFIRGLNKKYRGKDYSTDVLSFAQDIIGEEISVSTDSYIQQAGDIIISLETLEKTAKKLNVDKEEEFKRLIIHGLLHLQGLTHSGNSKDENMLIIQEKILGKLKEERMF